MAVDNNSPLQNTWEAAFSAIDASPNPYTAVRFVPTGSVAGVPSWSTEVDDWTVVPTYRAQTFDGTYVIREIGPAYVVTKTEDTEITPVTDHAVNLFDGANTAGQQPLVDPADLGDGTGDSEPEFPFTAGQVIGGLAVAYFGYKGLQAAASAFGGTTETASESASTPEFSQLARAAQRLDDKQYNIFVSHSWTYDDHYERIVDFLEEVPSLDWQNHSVPSTDPLDVVTDEALTRELRNQLRTASVMVVSAGMYGAHSKWIPRELELAEELGKPVVAIVPQGQERVPVQIQETAAETVGWRQASLVDALADHG